MHIPDGLLDGKTMVTTAAVSVVGLSWAVRRASKELDDRSIPVMGVTAAFVFAAQLVNFPVWGGTSGHLVGGLLAAVVLGPAPAMVVMTTVLMVQALVFGDGGLLALGANVLNMAVIAPLVGYGLYLMFRRQSWALLVAAWFSIVISALAAAAELAWSDVIPLSVVMPPMLVWHALIGVGEAIITYAVVRYLRSTRPDLLRGKTW